ncbi:Nucleotide-binding, alpha-beta plait [Metarhizium rileyi]|uniref:Nucleotide-binding, alpha-beta plait n=1 Tax=Metarhizium rileyi (strain RCEF 4871) TaxID=1649241 RepID=A0A162KDR9_METRR|nr:Nucleotide-binding, alpha-beta plait [Metarhizium rileyi RCEF 4871]
MIEPEAELQASANLSPVSPSPVHTAAPLVVPTLQDTVDTIDAMVAAAAGAAEAHVDKPVVDPALAAATDNDDVVDDDSLTDPYGEDTALSRTAQAQLLSESLDVNDDYAKTFDSPIEPDNGDGEDNDQVVSPNSQEPNPISIAPEQLRASQSSEVSPATTHDPSATSSTPPPASNSHQKAQPEPFADPAVPAPADHKEDLQQDQDQNQGAQSKPTNGSNPHAMESQSSSSLDIQKLVADLTAQPAESSIDSDPSPTSPAQAEPPPGSASLSSSTALPSTSSLPPRPPQPHSTSPLYASQHHPAGANPSAATTVAAQPSAGQSSSYHIGGAPGTSPESVASLPLPPSSGLNAPPYSTQAASVYSADQGRDVEYQRQWDQFMADERQYMSEAKWDRFPEGSRIFIGNLSSDKVSKRDVFELFYRYGRLAQISLKSAYGFVQYHSIEEGQRAMDNLQGTEIKGRRIHLEISRVQDKSKKDRNRSPDRGRGRENGRRGDKHSRDDYRPGRNHSPRRNEYHREDTFGGRDHGYSDSGRGGRGRSRSPAYGRTDRDAYRRRSPSPQGRPRTETELDIPRRYGVDVPDVQIILQPDVNRDFVNWIEGAFKVKGLKSQVMYLHPRFPKDQVIQRQAAEGVHGVVDLDLRAQNLGRVPVQVFDRSAGSNNVRFDQYVDLDPGTAAEVILRAKSSAAPANYDQGYAGNGAYVNPYGAQHQQPGFGRGQQPAAYPLQPQQQPPGSAADIAALVGQVDNATLQRLLSTIQGQAATPPAAGSYPHSAVSHTTHSPQVDIQAILGSLGGTAPQQLAPPQASPYGPPYGGPQPNGGSNQGAGGNNGDAASQVQNIMAQLARYRQ